jgi:uncharacterized protein (DUF1330 family)
MPAYVLLELKFDDRSWLGGYVPPVEALIKKHGGRYIGRAFEYEQLEGDRRPDVIVILEFPSMDAARAWYNDPEYEPYLKMRLARAKGDIFLVPGE